MSAARLIVGILVAAGDAHSPESAALASAAADALGPGASVVIEEATAALTDGEALKLGRRLQAAAVVEVIWPNPAHGEVALRAHVAAGWTERRIAFQSLDTPVERGRAVGFAL